jgi:hypothetical protein
MASPPFRASTTSSTTGTPRPCGCPTAGVTHVDETRHAAWHEQTGQPVLRCLARCYCTRCPQHARQRAHIEALVRADFDARIRKEQAKKQNGRAAA